MSNKLGLPKKKKQIDQHVILIRWLTRISQVVAPQAITGNHTGAFKEIIRVKLFILLPLHPFPVLEHQLIPIPGHRPHQKGSEDQYQRS